MTRLLRASRPVIKHCGMTSKVSVSTQSSTSDSLPRLSRPSHHRTWNLPEDLPRTTLPDGSLMILRQKEKMVPSLDSLPPPLRPKKTSSQPLTLAQKEEITTLRLQDPNYWTVSRLSKKFEVPPLWILNTVKCPAERRETLEKERAQEWADMSVRRKKVLLDRIRRKELW